MNRQKIDDCSNFLNNIKEAIRDQLDEEFTNYKLMCLENLDYTLECKRNAVIKQILDKISISMFENGLGGLEPTIQIKIVNQVRSEEK